MESADVSRHVPNGWEMIDYCNASDSTLIVLVRDRLHRYGLMSLNLFGLGTTLSSVIPFSESHFQELSRVFGKLPFCRIAAAPQPDEPPSEAILENLSRQVFTVEGFRVRLTVRSGNTLTSSMASYDYNKCARSTWSVSDWKQKRLSGRYSALCVEVLDATGIAVHGRTLLSTVRKTYEL